MKLHLLSTNIEVDAFNTRKLNEIRTVEFICYAEDNVKAIGLSRDNRNRILEALKGFKSSEAQGLLHKLLLKKSAKYMITVNINTGYGLVNGATGQLMQIDFDISCKPSTLWIKFSEASVGILARAQK